VVRRAHTVVSFLGGCGHSWWERMDTVWCWAPCGQMSTDLSPPGQWSSWCLLQTDPASVCCWLQGHCRESREQTAKIQSFDFLFFYPLRFGGVRACASVSLGRHRTCPTSCLHVVQFLQTCPSHHVFFGDKLSTTISQLLATILYFKYRVHCLINFITFIEFFWDDDLLCPVSLSLVVLLFTLKMVLLYAG